MNEQLLDLKNKISENWLKLSITSLASIILVVGLLGFQIGFDSKNCSTIEEISLSGYSMSPLLKPGENTTVKMGYYSCHNVSRNDVVLYDWSGQDTPLGKFVKALPSDKITFEGCNVLVNREIITNSEGEPYCLSTSRRDRLRKDIEANVNGYMLLGNDVSGTTDSSLFGLVHRENLLGKFSIDSR